MRVIAGKLGGRTFDDPTTHRTHPMSDRMRGALFNTLGDISGLTVLDAFSGTGALSFEAVSRGAAKAVALDNDAQAHKTITGNAQKLGVEKRVVVIRANASSWSNNNRAASFDIVLCDPPFDHLQHDLIEKLTRHAKPGGVVVLSWPRGVETLRLKNLELSTIKEKSYGDAQLVFYRKIQ